MNATHIYQVPSRTVPGRTYQVDLERGACNCTAGGKPIGLWIKLTVGGVTRLGYGSVTPEAYDPEKQLIGDALRNAAMRFGVALDLWSKSDLQAHDDDGAGTQMDAPPRRTPASYEAHRAGTQMDNGPRQGPAAEGDGYKQVTLLMGSERITSRHIAAVIGEFGKAQVEEWLSAEPGRTPAILIDYARAKRDQDETRRGGKVFE